MTALNDSSAALPDARAPTREAMSFVDIGRNIPGLEPLHADSLGATELDTVALSGRII